MNTFSKYLKYAALLCTLALTAACSEEMLDENGGRDVPLPDPEKVRVKLLLVPMEEFAEPATRTDADDIATLHVMTFNNSGEMTDAPQEASLQDGRYYVAMLNTTTDPRTVVILANATAALNTYKGTTTTGFPGGDWKVSGESGVTSANVTTLAHMRDNLVTANLSVVTLNSQQYITALPDTVAPPMHGALALPDGINVTTVITDVDGDGDPVPIYLERAIAKFTVETVGAIADFELLGASMGNTPRYGWLIPPVSAITASPPVNHLVGPGTTDLESGYEPFVVADQDGELPPLYSYERSKSSDLNSASVLLYASYKGQPGYYRLNLFKYDNDGTPLQYDIKRNTHFKVKITDVDQPGYATAAEALANRPLNIIYNVDVDLLNPPGDRDLEAYDIVSNGNYYLGVSNSTYYYYSSFAAASDNLVATTLIHNAGSLPVTTGTVAIEGPGLELYHNSPGLTTTIDPDHIRRRGTFNPANTSKIDIGILITPQFTDTSTGKLTIKLGNLTKEVAIRRRPGPVNIGGMISDFATGDFVVANTIGSPTPQWLRFATTAAGPGTPERIHSPSGNIYIHCDNNPGFDPYARKAEIFLARNDNGGRTKVRFEQPTSSPVPWDNMPWVGTFHRHDEMGERIIYSGFNGTWKVDVAEGSDFIRLSSSISPDQRLLTDNPGDPEDYLITTSTTSIINQTGNIRFRVALTGTIAPNQVRYGRIKLTLTPVGGTAQTRYIYVRQGEAPDYLLRPGDVTAPHDPAYARKFSPYNLTTAEYNAGSQSPYVSVRPSAFMAPSQAVFTQYPSQAGARFPWAPGNTGDPYAYHPTMAPFSGSTTPLPSAIAPGTVWDNLKERYELCPEGYHLPNAGPTDVAVSDPARSEWNSSLDTDGSSGFLGYQWSYGYYADGYFDRHPIESSSNSNMNNRVVRQNDSRVAYAGTLFYNSATHASLFFPAPGLASELNQALSSPGTSGAYLTSTIAFYSAMDRVRVIQLINTQAGMGYALNTAAAAIRCVEDKIYDGIEVGNIFWAEANLSGTPILNAGGNPTGKYEFETDPTAYGALFQWGHNDKVYPVGANGSSVSGYNTTDYVNQYPWPTNKNPCPNGWRLPTLSEFQGVINMWSTNITWHQGTRNGLIAAIPNGTGSAFFPAAGLRNQNGTMEEVNNQGHYWTSEGGSFNGGYESSYSFRMGISEVTLNNDATRGKAKSIRCVKEIP